MHILEKKIYFGLLVCLLISIVGVSFAYFLSSTTITGNGGKTEMNTANLIGVKFDAGDAVINLENVVPSTEKEKTFSVTIFPTEKEKTATYAIYIDINNNSFVKCSDQNFNDGAVDITKKNTCIKNAEELVYTLIDGDGNKIISGDLLEKNGKIILAKETKTVDLETNFNYKLSVTFKNTGEDQNHNANKIFDCTLGVEFAENN